MPDIDIGIPGEILDDLMTPKKLPRKVKAGPFTFLDNTPWCVFPNAVYKFAPCAVSIAKETDQLAQDEGEFTPYVSADLAVTKRVNAVDDLVRDGINMVVGPHNMPETGFSLLLPLKQDGNSTGQDFLLFGTEISNKFFRTLARARQRRSQTEAATKHACWFAVDYSSWPPSALEVAFNKEYVAELNELEKRALIEFEQDMEVYDSFIESHMVEMIRDKPDDFNMAMKPLKSPGTDRFNPDGTLFKKTDATYYPTRDFDMTGVGAYDEHNAYCKQSFYPLKKQLLDLIVPRANLRFEGLKAGLRGDPEWENTMKRKGAARESLIAWRINNPDELLFVKEWKEKPGLWDVKVESIKPGDQLGDPSDDEWWSRLQGKPREIFYRTNDGYYSVKVSPFQLMTLFKRKFEAWVNKGHTSMKGKVVFVRQIFTKMGSWLRARIIMPAKWSMNMFDGTVVKFFAKPLEHCQKGFPSLKQSSLFFTYVKTQLAEGHHIQKPWALDVSHFETMWASNPDMLLAAYGSNHARREYGADAASGFIASSHGPVFHGPQTSSGIGPTTWHSLTGGLFLASMDIGYRSTSVLETAQYNWRSLLCCAIDYAISHYNLKAENPFGAYQNRVSYHPITKPSALCSELTHAGSDDQGGWLISDDLTEAEAEALLRNPESEKWRAKTHMSIELDIGPHFGVVRTPDGVEPDLTAADWKVALMEHKVIGDLIAAAMYLVLSSDQTGLADDFQEALDAINGGDWHSYRKGLVASMHVCRNAPGFISDIMQNLDPEESPKGRVMSELLESAGFEVGLSTKIPTGVTTDIVDTYLKYIKNEPLA